MLMKYYSNGRISLKLYHCYSTYCTFPLPSITVSGSYSPFAEHPADNKIT